ncbi:MULTISPECIES: tyrosine-type recombinase/integrase [Bacillus]|uniref:tyrosine-type recombinase/integrase n=1 Tax=Bacillus TaxID=1386 RepID=UPI000D0298AF|nr:MULTISPECIES: site-specific integrase [Bacillus]MCB6219057.1 site-specific integrase [Bacillus paralicheniformis]MDN5390181.1 site-specific integrase [Bacillus sp. LB7]
MISFSKVYKNKVHVGWKGTAEGPKHPVTGKRQQITRRGKTQAIVKEKILQALKDIESNLNKPIKSKLIKDYLPEWLELYKKGKVKPSTYRAHYRNIHKYLIPEFGHIQVNKLTRAQYQSFINKLLTSRKTSSVSHINATMSNAMRQAYLNDEIVKNPCTGVIIKKIEEIEEEKKIHYWAKNHIKQFLNGFENEEKVYYYFFLTLIYAGPRKGEAMALQEEDLDFENDYIDINKTLLYHLSSEEAVFGPPKTKHSKRRVKIDPFLSSQLKQLITVNKKNRLSAGSLTSPHRFVFCKKDGSRLRERTIQNVFTRVKRKTGVPDISIHDLRHTHAVMMLEAEASMKEVQERLGHKDIRTTSNIYSHITPKMENEAVNKFSKYMAD